MGDKKSGLQTKAGDFVWLVQAGYVAWVGELRRGNQEDLEEVAHKYHPIDVFNTMCSMTDAIEHIPDELGAIDAASEFIAFVQHSHETGGNIPYWLAGTRSDDPRDYCLLSKRDRFLAIVQPTLLADAEYRAAADHDREDVDRHSAAFFIGVSRRAILAAARIPNELEHGQAAREFVAHNLDDPKERPETPSWLKGLAEEERELADESQGDFG